MPEDRMLHLGAFMRPVSIHTAAWRYPGGLPDANFNLKHITRFAQRLEEGRFDAFFMADHLAVLNMPMAALKRSATVTSFGRLKPGASSVSGLSSVTAKPPSPSSRRPSAVSRSSSKARASQAT